MDGLLQQPPQQGVPAPSPQGGVPSGMPPQGAPPPAGMPPQQAQPPQGDPAAQGIPDIAKTKPNPERDYNANPLNEVDVAEYEKFVVSAQKLIHSEKSRDVVLERIGKSEQGPINDIASLALTIIDRIDLQTVKEEGKKIDDAVKIQGANMVVGELIDIAEISGKIPKMTDDEKAVTYSYAVQKYTDRMIANGETTKQKLQLQMKQVVNDSPDINTANVPDFDASLAGEPASAKPKKQNPFNPTQTMSQKLEQGGLLNGQS
jgi:hypothetical protein